MSRLFYDKPSGWEWENALPIGNGKLGAMVYGEADMEHYQLNEDSLWSGSAKNRINPDAKKNFEKVRQLIFAGKIPQAERLLKFAFTGTPQSQCAYQTLGDLYIDLMDSVTEPVGYSRELDLDTAVHTVRVTDNNTGITFFREAFSSAVEDVIVTHLSSDADSSVAAGVMASRLCMYQTTWHEKDQVFFSGKTDNDGVEFCVGIKMTAMGGDVEAIGEHLVCERADHITVFLAAATSYREKDPVEKVKKTLALASAKQYDSLKSEHIKEYQSFYNTCSLYLAGDDKKDILPTDQRLEKISKENPDNGLVQTYFDFGRYLLISCSRPGSLPANLQGIWNNQLNPPWQSKYTININTEMNYWPSETLGLSGCHMPLFEHMKKMMINGKNTAKEMYGCRGFVAHHNTDIWADTAPQDMYIPATYWVMGGAWLCTHIWEHYCFTKDKAFLIDMYEIIREAIVFFMDFLVEHDGKYVTCPSVSPENTYILPDGTRGCICFGATMDNEILRDLFHIGMKAGRIVGEEQKWLNKVEEICSKLPELKIGSKGQLLEWVEEYDEAEPGHRHISHLYGLYPSSQIQMEQTPELISAAKVTLERRLASGGGHTGWSRAWMIGMYARLWQKKDAYNNLLLLLQNSTQKNMLDTHPPFQIDGNFGAAAAIGEMILQSNKDILCETNQVVLLPAIPDEWDTGCMKGICARGGAIYDVSWEHGKLTDYTIHAICSYEVDVKYNGTTKHFCLKEGETMRVPL